MTIHAEARKGLEAQGIKQDHCSGGYFHHFGEHFGCKHHLMNCKNVKVGICYADCVECRELRPQRGYNCEGHKDQDSTQLICFAHAWNCKMGKYQCVHDCEKCRNLKDYIGEWEVAKDGTEFPNDEVERIASGELRFEFGKLPGSKGADDMEAVSNNELLEVN